MNFVPFYFYFLINLTGLGLASQFKSIFQLLEHKKLKNQFSQLTFMSIHKTLHKLHCLLECNRKEGCFTIEYDYKMNICNLFNKTITDSNLQTNFALNSIIGYKKLSSYNEFCSSEVLCDVDKNLECINSICNCINSSLEWIGIKCDWKSVTTYLTADAQTSWGIWGPVEVCPNREPAIGFTLKVEGPQSSADDTALNAISIICNSTVQMKSTEGLWGVWDTPKYCPTGSYLIGFSFSSEPNQSGDSTAGNDIMMKCNDNTVLNSTIGGIWGIWGTWFECSLGHICGIQTLVEPDQGGSDDTSLNSVQFTCCFH